MRENLFCRYNCFSNVDLFLFLESSLTAQKVENSDDRVGIDFDESSDNPREAKVMDDVSFQQDIGQPAFGAIFQNEYGDEHRNYFRKARNVVPEANSKEDSADTSGKAHSAQEVRVENANGDEHRNYFRRDAAAIDNEYTEEVKETPRVQNAYGDEHRNYFRKDTAAVETDNAPTEYKEEVKKTPRIKNVYGDEHRNYFRKTDKDDDEDDDEDDYTDDDDLELGMS